MSPPATATDGLPAHEPAVLERPAEERSLDPDEEHDREDALADGRHGVHAEQHGDDARRANRAKAVEPLAPKLHEGMGGRGRVALRTLGCLRHCRASARPR